MTPFGSLLNNEEIANVLTFVRNTWGNEAPAVKVETVSRIRNATHDRSIFWKPEELLKDHPLETAAEPTTPPATIKTQPKTK